MRFFAYRHQVRFDDTMAYGSHHFLTNFKFQCWAREALLFLGEPDGTDPWREGLLPIELLTQQGYARNLGPVRLGDRVVVLMSCDDLGHSSFRLCFRVIDADGRPVTCGYQVIVVVDKAERQVGKVPEFIRRRLAEILEPAGADTAGATQRGGGALRDVFPSELCTRAAEVAGGRVGLPGRSVVEIDAVGDEGRLVAVCPGQGSYDPTLLHEAIRLAWFRDLASEAESLAAGWLGPSFRLLRPASAEDGPARIAREQLGIYLGAIACGRLLREAHGEPALVMGHSVGEVAALVLGGVLTARDGARVIVERTRALVEHGPRGAGLLAVPMSRADALPLLADGKAGRLAVVNGSGQVVVAGTDDELAALARRAGGVTCRRLASDFPFHSPLMLPAVRPFADALAGLVAGEPRVPVRSPMERADWRPEWDLPSVLASHLIRPLDFAATVASLARDGRWRFVECSRRGAIGRVIERIIGPSSPSRVVAFDVPLPAEAAPAPHRADAMGGGAGGRFVPVAVVGWGACLPGAPNLGAYAALLDAGLCAVQDRRRTDPACGDDFLGAPGGEPDRTYTMLGGVVEAIPPWPDRFAPMAGGRDRPRVWRMTAAALDECLGGLATPPAGRSHAVVGSTADGCDAYDDAIALERLHAAGLVGDAVLEAGSRQLGGRAGELDHHRGFRDLVRCALGPDAGTTVVDAACASSLYAVDVAARLLARGDAELVIAGGAFAPGLSNNCLFAQFRGLSATGSRPLDARADGVVFGEGAAFVALKRLDCAIADGDRILGVIRGTGLSSDGRGASVSRPSAEGQELALRRAYSASGVDPARVRYVEAHATGTPVGDRVEFNALSRVFSAAGAAPGSVGLGSVKSQIGHTGWAAGAASLIKALIALEKERLPAQHGYQFTDLPLADGPFSIAAESRPWPISPGGGPRAAGVNSFGFGGANCHAIVESYDAEYHHGLVVSEAPPRTTVVCASAAVERTRAEMETRGPGGVVVGLLPDVVDTMDESQRLAAELAGRILGRLPSGWVGHRERIGVVVSMPGKTGAIVAANDRILNRRMGRLVPAWGGRLDRGEALGRLGVADSPTGPYTLTGGMPNITAARVCQVHGLNGPNIVIDEGGAPGAARSYAESLVADGTCAAVIVMAIEPEGGCWRPERYRARADLLADAATAAAEGWTAADPAPAPVDPAEGPSAAGFDTTAEIRLYRTDLVPCPADGAAHLAPRRLLILADARTRGRLGAGPFPPGWEVADLERGRAPVGAEFDGVVLVTDLDGDDLLGESEPWRARLGPLLHVSRSHYGAIADGRLGLAHVGLRAFDGPLPGAVTGLIGGFMKSLGRELPRGRIAAVHGDDDDVAAAVGLVLAAWGRGGGPPWESFRRGGGVYRHALREVPDAAERAGGPPALVAGDLVVATGGARGITAELVAGLLGRFGCRVVLLGRSDPEQVPPEWRGLDAAGVAAREPEFHRQGARRGVNLRESRRAFERLQAAHEVLDNLRRFEALPGSVEYRRCDVTRLDEVRAALTPVLAPGTPVRLVVHGAGVQVSGRLDRKDPETFWRVLDTKIGGLKAVLKALEEGGQGRPDVHIATSAFSYFGNDGQQDYGAANEALNRLADVRGLRAEAGGPSWTALAWLAWDGIGMTRGSEYRSLARERKMRGVRGPEGADLFTGLLERGRRGASVLMTDNERDRYGVDVAPDDDLRLDWASPALREHRVNGRPVCPACVSLARMVAAARSARPGATATAVEDCRFERPLTGRVEARVRTRALPAGPGGPRVEAWIEADLRAKGGGVVLQEGVRFASCRVCFDDRPASLAGEGNRPEPLDALESLDPYRHPDSPVRLGPIYECLGDIRLSPLGNTAVFSAPPDLDPTLWQGAPPPLAVDALLRLGVLHEMRGTLPVYVPVSIGRVAWVDAWLAPPTRFDLGCDAPVADGDKVRCARATLRDEDGRVMLTLEGYEGHRVGRVRAAVAGVV